MKMYVWDLGYGGVMAVVAYSIDGTRAIALQEIELRGDNRKHVVYDEPDHEIEVPGYYFGDGE